MKRYLVILIALMSVSVFCASAEEAQFNQNYAIAVSDPMLAPLANPALLGFENCSGIGWQQLIKNGKWQDQYRLFFNSEYLSYVYEKNDEDVNTHHLATGFELMGNLFPSNLYAGTSYQWVNDKFDEGGFRSGLLFRPWNFSSFAATWDNSYHSSPSYQFGIGWRPLAHFDFMSDYRLELTADCNYAKEDEDYEFSKPFAGINTELLDGVKIGGGYDWEKENWMLSFSFCAPKLQLGNIYQSTDDKDSNLGFVYLSDKAFKSLLTPCNSKWYTPTLKSELVTYKAPKYEIGPFNIMDSKQTCIEDLINEINAAAKDPTIQGLVFENKNFTSSFALRQELTDAVKEFKSTGKKVVFYYDNIGNGDYVFAASIADKIYLNPQGTVDLRGIAVNSPYLGEALNKIGVEVMNFRSHAYKSAGNMFSESEMTDAERAEYESLLGSLYAQMCEAIQSGRGDKLAKSAEEIIDNGPYYLAEDALRDGLVDGLIYGAQFDQKLKADFGKKHKTNEITDYYDYAWHRPKQAKVAVIYAQGNIVMGEGTIGKVISGKNTADLIRKVRKDKDYKGILLRVDSGGGSAQASDIIYKEIELAQTENKKPVVVSMSGVAASGGYYISANADYICAEPGTLTGSIGVVGLTISAEELFHKLYINWSLVKKGKHADFGNFTRKWTDEEKGMMQNLIAASYDDFVQKVAAGRNKTKEEIDAIAQGRVWTGEQALQNGLIDEIGGMQAATEKLKELAKIKGEVETVNVTPRGKKFSVSLKLDGLNTALNPMQSLPGLKEYAQLYDLWQSFEGDKALFISEMNLNGLADF